MNVPYPFQQPIKVEYPKDNKFIFEQWLMNKVDHPEYLPVNWCGFFVNNNYGKNERAMRHLQVYLNRLDRSKKYWTVTQYDLGVECGGKLNLSGLNLKIFGSGGGRIDFPIPLICHPHGARENERDIFASFVGSVTHPVRKEVLKYSDHRDWVVTDLSYDNKTFCDVMSRSVFALCPRGFGLSSFRICEALEQGAIPVYISDEWIVPGNIDFNTYGVLVHSSEVDQLDAILYNISKDKIKAKQEVGIEIYKQLYTFEGCKQLILQNL